MDEIGIGERKVLEKIGDDGAGLASEALSTMTGKKCRLSLSWLGFYDLERIPRVLGDIHELITAVYLEMGGEIKGSFLLVLPKRSALMVADMLQNRKPTAEREFDEMDLSALKELGNILGNSYINSLSDVLEVNLLDSIPHITTDMINAILGAVLGQYGERAQKALVLKSEISIESQHIKSDLLIFFDPDSEKTLIKKVKRKVGRM